MERLCIALDVSVSGYYAWVKRPKSKRTKESERLIAHIKNSYEQSRNTYGSPRVWLDLKNKGIACSENRIARLMKSHQIAAERKRKFVITTDSKHDLPVAENKLNQDFTANRPNEKWVTDITYVWTKEGWRSAAAVVSSCRTGFVF